MNILKRYQLKKQQRELMQMHSIYERLQTEHNEDEYFYQYVQQKMDAIDEKVEYARRLLEEAVGV